MTTAEAQKISPHFVFVVPGDPVPWARPKPSSRGIYDGQKHLKLVTISHITNQLPQDFLFLTGPLEMIVTFYMAQPRKRTTIHADDNPHFFRPDLSNLIKHIEDCCTGLLFNDDSLISSITAHKKYGTPRTEFILRELSNDRKENK